MAVFGASTRETKAGHCLIIRPVSPRNANRVGSNPLAIYSIYLLGTKLHAKLETRNRSCYGVTRSLGNPPKAYHETRYYHTYDACTPVALIRGMCCNRNQKARGTIAQHVGEMKDTNGTLFCWDAYLLQCCTRLSSFWGKLVVKLPFFVVLFSKANSLSDSLVGPPGEIARTDGHLPRRCEADTLRHSVVLPPIYGPVRIKVCGVSW